MNHAQRRPAVRTEPPSRLSPDAESVDLFALLEALDLSLLA